MRALVFTATGTVELQDVAEPTAASDELIVSVVSAGICGSDLNGIREPGFRRPPLIMGHEFVGITSDGLRVVVNPLLSCGECDRCRDGAEQLCRSRALIGVHRAGGFAERAAVPASAVHELPADISWTTASIIEPIANAVHAWSVAGAPAGKRIGVLGCGAIGLVCLQLARRCGAAYVAAADLSAQRRDVAQALGADSVAAALVGEFDVIFDAVGAAETRRASVALLRPGGQAIWLGLHDDIAGFGSHALVREEKVVRGSFAYTPSEFEHAISVASRWDASWVSEFSLDKGVEIFANLMDGQAEPIKALLTP